MLNKVKKYVFSKFEDVLQFNMASVPIGTALWEDAKAPTNFNST